MIDIEEYRDRHTKQMKRAFNGANGNSSGGDGTFKYDLLNPSNTSGTITQLITSAIDANKTYPSIGIDFTTALKIGSVSKRTK